MSSVMQSVQEQVFLSCYRGTLAPPLTLLRCVVLRQDVKNNISLDSLMMLYDSGDLKPGNPDCLRQGERAARPHGVADGLAEGA